MTNLLNTVTFYLALLAFLAVVIFFIYITLPGKMTKKWEQTYKFRRIRKSLKQQGIDPESPEGRAITGRLIKGQSIYDPKELIQNVHGAGRNGGER